jgi:hypothetical protein
MWAVWLAATTAALPCDLATETDLSECRTNSACYDVPPSSNTCPEVCSELNDVETLLEPLFEVEIDIEVHVLGEAESTAVTVGRVDGLKAYAQLTIGRLVDASGAELTEAHVVPTGVGLDIESGTIETTVSYTPTGRVILDPAGKALFSRLSACFGTTPFSEDAFTLFYGIILWSPIVLPSSADTSLRNPSGLLLGHGGCPVTAGSILVGEPTVTTHGCFPANLAQSRCLPLTACGPGQFESNAGARTKTEDVVCSNLRRCDPATEEETTKPTATTDRVCSPTTKRCSLDDGTVDGEGGCVPIEPCAPGTDHMVAVATEVAGPVCAPVSAECATGNYEAAAATLQSDRQCTPVSGSCDLLSGDLFGDTGTFRSVAAVPDASKPEVDFFQAAAATSSTDRECRGAALCSADEDEDIPPTASTDRECHPLPPPPPPECDPYGSGDCETQPDTPAPTLSIIWNGVVLVAATFWALNVNQRETGTMTGVV